MNTKNNGSPQCPNCGRVIVLGDQTKSRYSKYPRCPNKECNKDIIVILGNIYDEKHQLISKYIKSVSSPKKEDMSLSV